MIGDAGSPAKQGRLHRRVEVALPATLAPLEESGQPGSPLEVTIVDISAGGARIVASARLTPDRRFHLGFTIGDRTIETIVQIVHITDRGGQRQYGVRLVDVSMPDRSAITKHVFTAAREAAERLT